MVDGVVFCLLSSDFSLSELIPLSYSFTCLSRGDPSEPLSISDDVGIRKFLQSLVRVAAPQMPPLPCTCCKRLY